VIEGDDPRRVPRRLAELHRDGPVGARSTVRFPWGDDVSLDGLVEGAGFALADARREPGHATVTCERTLTLPDLVAPGMAVLVVGLNPSVYAAERGVAFARPGNRFWPAALAAGLVPADRDPWAALDAGIGFTDLVKRASPRADGLTNAEYLAGADRVEALVAWLAPAVVCFAGLTGYRTARERGATTGQQVTRFGGAVAYVMPNPSGINAHARLEDLTEHLRRAAVLAGTIRRSTR